MAERVWRRLKLYCSFAYMKCCTFILYTEHRPLQIEQDLAPQTHTEALQPWPYVSVWWIKTGDLTQSQHVRGEPRGSAWNLPFDCSSYVKAPYRSRWSILCSSWLPAY